MYPNVEGSDIDIDKNPLLRLSPAHPWKPKHQFQHLYAPLAYAVALAHSVFWGDWIYLLSKDYAWMRRGVSSLYLYASFFGFKAVHFFLMIALPYLMLDYSLATIILCYLGVGALASLAFIVMLVGTHFFAEADYPAPDDRGVLHTCWAVHNLRTSCDWNPESGFARFLSGGANCHAAHHLFPTICHTHYGKLNRIILAASAEYSITYHRKTLWQMAISHFDHLKLMGRRPQQGNDSQNRRLSPGSASTGPT
jgi:linoleoyl-CoA desaturase